MRKRIQVYTEPDIKRRIELAAARRDLAVTEYCLDAILEQLEEDDMLEREQIEIPVKPPRVEHLSAELETLQEKILSERGGKLIMNLDTVIEEMHEEREQDILGLR